MLPVHDVNPTRRVPVVTYVLLVANFVVFLMSPVATYIAGSTEVQQQCRQVAYFDEYGARPKELLTNEQAPPRVVVDESREPVCPTPSYEKQPFLSALTAMFVHGGWLHLLGNLLFLYVFGNNVEDRLGRLRFLGFYLGSGLAATYGFAVLNAGSGSPVVGASGAIAGVLGAYLVLFPRAKVWTLLTFFFFLPVRLPAWLVLGTWFVLQYFLSRGTALAEGSDVAYSAHIIGFLVGAAMVWKLRGTAQPRQLQPRFGPYARR